MVKLTKDQKIEVVEMLKSGVPEKEIKEKFGINSKQMYVWRKKVKDQAPVSDVEVKNLTSNESDQEKIPVDLPDQEEELSLSDIIPDQVSDQTIQDAGITIDPNKDYCGNCYSQNIITEIQKGQEVCSVCGGILQW